MPHPESVQVPLSQAMQASGLESVVVVGKGADGKIQLFLTDGDREKLIILLERAKSQLVRSLD